MAEPYQPISVNTGSAQQAIQSTQLATPALGDLMSSIKEGFISADDIRKRVQSGPLEAATRAQDMADVSQIRPLMRQADVAQLQNAQAKLEFEAQTLPILNATKRATLEQAHQNALEFGLPEEILKVFYATVPSFIPFDPDKLHDKKTGMVNIPYANEMIIKAKQEAAKMALNAKFTGPVAQKATDASGKMTETTTVMNQLTAQPVGRPIVTEEKAAQTGTNIKDYKSTRITPDGLKEEEIVVRVDGNGNIIGETILGSKAVKLTQEQANALQFSDRMGFNNAMISDLAVKGFDPTALKTTAQSFLPNRIQPEALQSYTAAKGNWITAALRKESGAAISPSEYTQANKEYFPRDGDSPAVVKQKEALRLLAEEDIRLSTPGQGFWNPGGRNKNTPAAAAASGAQPAPVAPGAPALAPEAPVIDSTDPVAGAAAANALPSNVQFFKWAGSEQKWNNPNYIAPR